MSEKILEVRQLATSFHTERGWQQAIDGVSFDVYQGEILGIVGESGCGKSVTSQSIMRLYDERRLVRYSGTVKLEGQSLLDIPFHKMQDIRGSRVSMIFQDALSSLNPVLTICDQISEPLRIHQHLSKKAAREKALEMLRLVGIPAPEKRLDQYPHELSGGMRQRVMIAIALACRPHLLIADEPTTALDVTIQAQIMELIVRLNEQLNMGVILVYYIAATLLPVDKIIGRIYPVFGFALLFMAVGILVVLLFGGEYTIPEFTSFENCIADAKAFPIVPMLFTTIACGAISGFHATQSPLMARCMRNERESRSVFYGAMISESIIALVWAAIAMAFWGDVAGLNGAIAEYGGQAAVMIDVIANKTLGPALAVFVIFGVVACAITSGDTAFRSARLIVADFMGVEQRTLRKRIYICIPLFALGLLIIFGLPFQTMWSYFAWMNQTLAAVTLWMIVAYLRHRGRAVWVGLIPALVMTYVCASYIFVSPLMLGMQNRTAAYLLGGGVTFAVLVAMIFKLKDNDAKGIS